MTWFWICCPMDSGGTGTPGREARAGPQKALLPTCSPGHYSRRPATHSPSIPQRLGRPGPGVSLAPPSPTHTMPRTRQDTASGCSSSLRPSLMPPRARPQLPRAERASGPLQAAWGRVGLLRTPHCAPVSASMTPRVPGSVCSHPLLRRGLRM